MIGDGESNGGERGRDKKDTDGPTTDDPPGTNRDLDTDRRRHGGVNRRGTQRQNQERGKRHRYERRRLAGGCGGKVYVEEVPRRERMWGAGYIKRELRQC